jgi:hypothetical protein
MDDDTSQSKVNDEELDQMIANISGQPATAPAVVGNSGAPISSSDGSTVSSGQDNSASPTATPASVAPPINSSQVPETEGAPPSDLAAPASPSAPSASAPPPTASPPAVTPPITPAAAPNELVNIKRDALAELRPLVDKLTLPPEEKFNTLLLIIRSTDDASLLPAAHAAARAIPDENHRAQALLDVIKEVDFFGQSKS